VCAPSFAQKAAVKALETPPSDAMLEAYRQRRDIAFDRLRAQFSVVRPTGAFYIFPQVPHGDAETFTERAIRNNVLVVPGSVFSERNTHFRVSFAVSIDTLKKGIEVLLAIARTP